MAKKKPAQQKKAAPAPAAPDPKVAELLAKIEALEAENAKLARKRDSMAERMAALEAASTTPVGDAEKVLRDQQDWSRRHQRGEA